MIFHRDVKNFLGKIKPTKYRGACHWLCLTRKLKKLVRWQNHIWQRACKYKLKTVFSPRHPDSRVERATRAFPLLERLALGRRRPSDRWVTRLLDTFVSPGFGSWVSKILVYVFCCFFPKYIYFLISHIFKIFFSAISCIFFALGYKLTLIYFGRSLNTILLFYYYYFSICQSFLFLLEKKLHKQNILSHILSLFFLGRFWIFFFFFLEKKFSTYSLWFWVAI